MHDAPFCSCGCYCAALHLADEAMDAGLYVVLIPETDEDGESVIRYLTYRLDQKNATAYALNPSQRVRSVFAVGMALNTVQEMT